MNDMHVIPITSFAGIVIGRQFESVVGQVPQDGVVPEAVVEAAVSPISCDKN